MNATPPEAGPTHGPVAADGSTRGTSLNSHGRRGASAAPSGVMDRTFAVLQLLAENANGLPISAVADRLGIPLSASHRLLSELAEHGFVQQERLHGDYRLTMRLVTLAFTYLARSGVTDIAQPVLDRLAAQSGELVRLAVMDGEGADRNLTWVARAQGAQTGLRYDPEMGQVATLSCSASGWAWLSTLDDEEALSLVERQGFGAPEEFGPRAPRNAKALLQALRQTRKRGYAVTMQTFTPWMSAMAAPVRAPDGTVCATISIAGPIMRLPEEKLHELAPLMLEAVAEMTQASLGSPLLNRALHGIRNAAGIPR